MSNTFHKREEYIITRKSLDNDKGRYVKTLNPFDFAIFSDKHTELWSTIKGAKIHHSIWGDGQIIQIEQRPGYIPLIYVMFENIKEKKTFNSESFKSGIIEAIYVSEAQSAELQIWKTKHRPVRKSRTLDKQPSFSDFGVNSLWHLTHKENIIGILEHGILNHCDASKF